jgi:creatinine amidohydrolase
MTAVPPRDWTDLHWPDIGAAEPARWIAVLPLAATEQHGPHLPLGTDVMIAQAYLARARELLPAGLPVTFLPLQPVGISTEHTDFPGTLTLSSEAALASWKALGASVALAGVKKLVIVTSHGGNSAAMALVAQDLRAELGLLVVTTSWARFGVRKDKIADFSPASIAMEQEYRWLSAHRPAPFAWQAQDLHASGASGDATLASVEKGELLLDHGARAFCELLTEVDKFDVNNLSKGPGQ